jgi:hypothetical protein
MRKVIRRRRCRWRRSLCMHHSRTRGCGLRSTAARSRRSDSAATRTAAATRSRPCTRCRAARTTESRTGVVVQSSCNLRMDLTRRSSRHSRVRSKSLAYRSRKRMICRNDAPRHCGSRGTHTGIRNRYNRSRRTPARRGLAVHNLLQAAMFKQNMLSGAKVVGCFAKLIDDPQCRSVVAMVINAGIAIACHTKPKVKSPGTFDRKAQIGREDDVAAICRHLHLDCTAIECEHQRLNACPCLARSYMQSARRADPHRSSSRQGNLGSVVLRGNSGAADQHRAAVRYLQRADNGCVLDADSADWLLRLRDRSCSNHEREQRESQAGSITHAMYNTSYGTQVRAVWVWHVCS